MGPSANREEMRLGATLSTETTGKQACLLIGRILTAPSGQSPFGLAREKRSISRTVRPPILSVAVVLRLPSCERHDLGST